MNQAVITDNVILVLKAEKQEEEHGLRRSSFRRGNYRLCHSL